MYQRWFVYMFKVTVGCRLSGDLMSIDSIWKGDIVTKIEVAKQVI